MENIQRNLEKEIAALTPLKSSRKTKRWTLLFVGDHGRVVTIRRFKGFAILWVSLMVVAIVVAGGLYFLYMKTKDANIDLRKSLKSIQQQVLALRDEKDILIARIVIAESEVDALKGGARATSVEKTIVVREETNSEVKNKSAETVDVKKEASAQIQPQKAAAATVAEEPSRPEISQSVSIEEFHVFHESDNNIFRAQFILRNTSPDSRPVSGYTAVILKPADAGQDLWLAMPSIKLSSGRPSGYKKGQYFSIARFKTVKFVVHSQFDPGRFSSASVFVYDAAKRLLLEKDFQIQVQSDASLPSE